MKKVFITGITGFAGIHLTEHLISKGNEVSGIFFPAETSAYFVKKFPGIKIHFCDLSDKPQLQQLLLEFQPDIIFHLAAISSVRYSFTHISKTIDSNIKGFNNVLEAASNLPYKPRFVFISSADVYEQSCAGQSISENFPLNPKSPYAISKYSSELFFKYYMSMNMINGTIIRPFNHIGPHQRDDFAISSFAKQVALIEKYGNTDSIVTGNLSAERDFTDVRDTVRAYSLISEIEKFENPEDRIINVATNNCYSMKNLLETLVSFSEVKNIKIAVDNKLYRKVDIPKLKGDYSKLNKLTGWNPEIKIEDTLLSTLNYWRQNV
ncbi:MAG TPA: GDP-mannose 4,6-dehydratase [bacterium]|nr:GDP-mannose 4,6-dehydratase [bacterium]HPN29614.1 GDP-mannose 4,6-dehydratase [bacterium]